jgi:hypothetical protein
MAPVDQPHEQFVFPEEVLPRGNALWYTERVNTLFFCGQNQLLIPKIAEKKFAQNFDSGGFSWVKDSNQQNIRNQCLKI